MDGQRADALHDHAGVAMGSVPLQVGTGVKQEQSQPWAKSQQNGDGWQAGAGTAVGREPNQGMEGRSRDSHGQSAKLWVRKASRDRATGAFLRKQKGDGQQQGNRGISA